MARVAACNLLVFLADAGTMLACLRALGAGYVFLRLPKTEPVPGRYRTELLQPFLTAEVERFREFLQDITPEDFGADR